MDASEGVSADLRDFNDSIDSVAGGTSEFIWKRHAGLARATIAVTVLLMGAMGYLDILFFSKNPGADPRFPIVLFLLPLLIPLLLYKIVAARMQKLFYSQLALALGYAYAPSAPIATASGHLFSIGHDQRISDVLSGTYRDHAARFYTLQFITGSGKSQETHEYFVCEIDAGAVLPEILIKCHTMRSIPFAPWQPPKTVPLTLEGDFNKSFDVYVPDGNQIEALEVLQPDLMASLMDGYASYSFECSGDKLYVFTQNEPRTKESFQAAAALVDQLFDKLLPRLAEIGTRA